VVVFFLNYSLLSTKTYFILPSSILPPRHYSYIFVLSRTGITHHHQLLVPFLLLSIGTPLGRTEYYLPRPDEQKKDYTPIGRVDLQRCLCILFSFRLYIISYLL